jgi:hypothetical protein
MDDGGSNGLECTTSIGKVSITCDNVLFDRKKKRGASMSFAIHIIPVEVCAALQHNHGFK